MILVKANMEIDLSRAEAEALIVLIEQEERQYPLDDLAIHLREKFGMCSKERDIKIE